MLRFSTDRRLRLPLRFSTGVHIRRSSHQAPALRGDLVYGRYLSGKFRYWWLTLAEFRAHGWFGQEGNTLTHPEFQGNRMCPDLRVASVSDRSSSAGIGCSAAEIGSLTLAARYMRLPCPSVPRNRRPLTRNHVRCYAGAVGISEIRSVPRRPGP